MMPGAEELHRHLDSGATSVCRAWVITRKDGVVFGFTDHDCDLAFDGLVFKAGTGLTARALQQTTGLSVDNSEAFGALSAQAVTEKDLLAGRYDAAELRGWIVNWANPEERKLQFRGYLGEVSRVGGAFQAELRGLTEMLNQPQGRVFHRGCSAVLGDGNCRFDTGRAGFSEEVTLLRSEGWRVFGFVEPVNYAERWFEKGRMIVVDGAAKDVVGVIKNDRIVDGRRQIELWQALGPDLAIGDKVRLEAGCDKRADTCRLKFGNFANFRGFPHIPGEDWLTSYPVSSQVNDGGSRMK